MYLLVGRESVLDANERSDRVKRSYFKKSCTALQLQRLRHVGTWQKKYKIQAKGELGRGITKRSTRKNSRGALTELTDSGLAT
jgi:hypothetical protein